ncbi:hypothetical protein DRQ53_11430 [bacterium]|nr:MAG: hypothetical protein DRQ53_11430 [bacterium]
MNDPRRILVIRRRAIGDVLVSVDVLRALREHWPQAEIVFVVDRPAVDMVRGSGLFDTLLVYDRATFNSGAPWQRLKATWHWLRRLRALRADLVLDLLATPQTAIWTRWTGAPVRVGPRMRKRSWAYTILVEPEQQPQFAGQRFLDWVRALGVEPGLWRSHAPLAAVEAAARLQARDDARPLVILNSSATWPAKAWPLDCFAELARQLADSFDVRLTWGPGEEAARDRIVEAAQGSLAALPPTTMPELGAWLERAVLLVTTDSGPKHLAVAMGTATLTLFGSTNPAGWQVPGGRHGGITQEVDCHPCNLTVCPVEGHPCLDQLSPSRVATKVRAMIAREDQGG